MRLNNRTTWTAVVAALPFVALASYAWIKAATDKSGPWDDAYLFGDLIYLLSLPLTGLVLGIPFYAGRYLQDVDNWWAIPLLDVLFALQWVIWSQVFSRRHMPKIK